MKKILSVLLAVVMSVPLLNVKAEVSVSARSAVVINASTGSVLYESNAYEKLPMASTTKIMTALILAEQPDLTREIVTTAEMVTVEGSSMGLLAGDTVSLYALLCGMLLSSGNDAANTTAIVLAGSTEKFAVLMNKKAKEIGMLNTNFVTPSGLDDENHYSTAYDMAVLAAYALKNETFAEVAASSSVTVSYGNPPYRRTLSNHNKLLKTYEGCVGVKTGFTKKSGRCLVSAATDSGSTVVAVTLNDPDDWADHAEMLDYGLSQLNPLKGGEFAVDVIGGERDNVKVYYDAPRVSLTKAELDETETVLLVPKFLYGEVESGSVVGRYLIKYKNETICSGEIKAGQSCAAAQVTTQPRYGFLDVLKSIFMFNESYKR